MIRAFHLLNVVKAAHRYGVRAIRQTPQHARHHEADVAGVVSIAEGFPLDVFSAVEVVADILNRSNLFHRVFQEEFRADRANKRHVCGGRHFRDVAQQRHILRTGVKFIG